MIREKGIFVFQVCLGCGDLRVDFLCVYFGLYVQEEQGLMIGLACGFGIYLWGIAGEVILIYSFGRMIWDRGSIII